MKTFVAVLLASSLAFADAPPADAPLAADESDTSVHVFAGEPVPFEGQLLSLDENMRRGKKRAELEAFKASVQTDVVIDRVVFYSLIGVSVVAVVTSISLGVALALRK